MAKKKEDGFEMLARLIKEEGEDIRKEFKTELKKMEQRFDKKLTDGLDSVRAEMRQGFAETKKRLDTVIQPQLDSQAHRIKAIEMSKH